MVGDGSRFAALGEASSHLSATFGHSQHGSPHHRSTRRIAGWFVQQPPWKASAVAWRMSPAPRRVKSVAGGRDVEADGCGHDEDGGAEFCD